MGIFDKIKSVIFGDAAAAPSTSANPTSAGSSPAPIGAPAGTPGSSAVVDVSVILDQAVAAKGQQLDWRQSIVDLMKVLDLDSDLGARKELAKELNYTGDTSDTATLNMWLHNQLMKKLAENGGKVPPDLMN